MNLFETYNKNHDWESPWKDDPDGSPFHLLKDAEQNNERLN